MFCERLRVGLLDGRLGRGTNRVRGDPLCGQTCGEARFLLSNTCRVARRGGCVCDASSRGVGGMRKFRNSLVGGRPWLEE